MELSARLDGAFRGWLELRVVKYEKHALLRVFTALLSDRRPDAIQRRVYLLLLKAIIDEVKREVNSL
jgi:hypothetical protein